MYKVNNPRFRNMFVYILILVAIVAIFLGVRRGADNPREITFTELANAVMEGRVDTISVSEDDLTILMNNKQAYISRKDSGSSAEEQLIARGVTPEQLNRVEWINERPSDWTSWIAALGYMLPLILVAGFIYLMLRQAQGTNNQALSFGKSRARMFTGDQPTVTFEDVAGADEAKEELYEVVEFLKEPEKFIQLGARIPKGVLLVGSPGTGKTLLAKAVSGEAGVPFFSISGSEFVEMFVGVGASRVRDLFDQAKRHSPCIVFVDEIDAVGRHRGAGLGGSHDEREQTLNQILVEMDGFDTDTNVIIVAATNRPDILDPALLRPGRFDRRVVLDRPDMRGREEILKVHVRGKPLASDVKLEELAKSIPGFVGADIENLVNEAAIVAARKNKKSVSHNDFEEAIERVILGPERRSRIMTQEEKRVTAYHEAGHAIVEHFVATSHKVRKVTIMPRGMALGVTWSMPDEDLFNMSASQLRETIAGLLGGRTAEEIVFGEITTGASNDLDRVTKVARAMVTRYGMSELGPMVFGQKEELVFLGREIGEQRDYSEAVAQEIDTQVRKIITEEHERAREILVKKREALDTVAERLLEVETIDRAEFLRLIGAPPDEEDEDKPKATPSPSTIEKPKPADDGEELSPGMPPAPAPA
ncbi:MAG: ATP-dependent zinc metalloprotease FtsH [Anaerolineae bacterium]|nr:ATP-dependent zinc metalloprotease FtsH [Anaerolineae bacterium]